MTARLGAGTVLVLAFSATAPALPQQPPAGPRPPWGAEFWLPAFSLLIPGLGQYAQHASGPGLAYTGAGALGLVMLFSVDSAKHLLESNDLPRTVEGQRALFGESLYTGAGELSAYDSFRRSVPALKLRGRYHFLPEPDPLSSLFTAPFDPHFLGRWTTWIHLAYTGAIVTLIAVDATEPGRVYLPYRFHDAVFGTALSYQAGVGEEAWFRGWFFPMVHDANGEQMWLSNSLQAVIFGGLHAAQAGPFALVITGWAWYEGWLTKRNGWSIRESIFHHFWYDVAAFAVTLATEERPSAAAVISLPPISFRTPSW
jgi:hypothetical protein